MQTVTRYLRGLIRFKLLAKVFSIYFIFSLLYSPFVPILSYVSKSQAVNVYDFEVDTLTLPTSIKPDEEIEIPIKLLNIGSDSWQMLDSSNNPLFQLSYKLNSAVEGEVTDLLSNVNGASSTPDNITDTNQTIKIKAPALEGNYTFEVFLYKNDESINKFIQASLPKTYTLKVETPLNPDTTAPEGNLEIVDGTQATNVNLSLKLTANDPEVVGDTTSGIEEFRLSQNVDFSDVDWEVWGSSPEKIVAKQIVNVPGEYTFYVQYKDKAGNLSSVYSDSITFISTAPTGSFEIDKDELVNVDGVNEVQDNNLKLYLAAQSNVEISEYIISTDNDFSDDTWVAFDSLNVNQLIQITQDIPDISGQYSFYVKYKNIYNQESDIYSATINYTHFDISPGLALESGDVLFGGEMDFSAELKNDGVDIGYNAKFEIILPRGFSFIKPLEYKDGGKVLEEGGIAPTFITTRTTADLLNPGSTYEAQVLIYEGIDDLLPGESTAVHMRLAVGGLNDGYKLGDKPTILVNSELFKRINFSTGFTASSEYRFELKPYIINYESAGTDDYNNEVLIGDDVSHQFILQTNPDIGSDDVDINGNNPMIVMFELDNGIEYQDGTYNISNYTGDPTDIIFNIENLPGVNTVLSWIFTKPVGTDYYLSPIVVSFYTKLPVYNSALDRYTLHNESLSNTITSEGRYTNPVTTNNPEPESNIYTTTESNNIVAKYFTVEKWGTPYFTDIGENIRYTIRITTSEYYNLTGIEITDTLPDGVNYLGNISFSEDLSLVLFGQSTDPVTASEILTWRITDANGVQAGDIYEFSYDVSVPSSYDLKNYNGDLRLSSGDHLVGTVSLEGLWSDVDPNSTRAAIDTDTDSTGQHLPEVTYSEGVKREDQDSFIQDLDVRIGDILDVYAEVDFPENVPTHDFNYRLYLPVGTELNGEFTISPTGVFSSDPISFEQIEGGYLWHFATIEGGSKLRIEYKLNVLDDENLKLAVKVRNLFRSDFENIDGNEETYRNSLTLNLIEPKIEFNKVVESGYLAKGESAVIQIVVRNTGTDTAYNLNFSDTVPSNTSYVVGSAGFQSGNTTFNFDEVNNKFVFDNFNLGPNEELVFTYQVLTDSDVLFGDNIDSQIIFSSYKNRSDIDILPYRTYPSVTTDYNWGASEPLLITNIERPGFDNSENVPIGRDDEFTFRVGIQVVGDAPVYDSRIVIDLNQLSGLSSDVNNIPFEVQENNISRPDIVPQVSNGIYTIEDIDLSSTGSLYIYFTLKTSQFAAFDIEYPVTITAYADDKLSNEIRKDGSNENPLDIDNDDYSNKVLKIQKLDNLPPQGEITFVSSGSIISVTNKNNVDVNYSATDMSETGIKAYIVGVRFTDDYDTAYGDQNNWYVYNTLTNLDTNIVNLLGQTGEWNLWSGDFSENGVNIENEGKNYKYMEIVDLYGNVDVEDNYIIKDTKPPVSAYVNISPFESDLTNPIYTGFFNNYVNFYAVDNSEGLGYGDYSDIGQYSYSLDNITWTGWVDMQGSVDSINLDFPTVSEGEYLNIYFKIRDYAGNEYPQTLFDEIQYTKEIPLISILLENGSEYTKNDFVELGLNITDSIAGVNKIRFADNIASIDSSSWEDYDSSVTTHILPESWTTGVKGLCVQMLDRAGNASNVSCDNIILDKTGPIGVLGINGGAFQTEIIDVVLNIAGSDQILDDSSNGIGQLMMKISNTGEDCSFLNTDAERVICEQSWTDWLPFSNTYNWQLEDYVGEHWVYLRLQDGLGNESGISSSRIYTNPYIGTGNIVINNNDVFTNSKYVLLDLDVDMLNFNCDLCTRPLLMRFYQTGENDVAPIPPIVSSPSDNSNGWSYWEEYPTGKIKQWDLDPNNIDKPNYGKKNVYVQYMLPNAEVTDVYYDSIIYAPFYGIEYLQDSSWNKVEDKLYGLGQVPTTALTQNYFNLVFNVKNTGSFTWPKDTENPVHITYRWKRVGGEIPANWQNTDIIQEYRGNAVILPENISWNEETGEIILRVDTPLLPGQYQLIIDAIHEGTAWFGDFANSTPTFNIDVTQNPDKSLPDPIVNDSIEVPEGIGSPVRLPAEFGGGWGKNCDDNYGHNYGICYIGGILENNPDPTYTHRIISNGHLYNFIISEYWWDPHIGEEVVARVNYLDGYHFNGVDMALAPKYWRAERITNPNIIDPSLYQPIHLYHNDTKTVQLKFLNTGNGVWYRGQVFLVALDNHIDQGGRERPSVYYNSSTWFSTSRINLDPNNSGYGKNAVGSFTFTLKVPSDLSYGSHKECFVVTRDDVGWEYRESMCLDIYIEMTQAEQRQYMCSLPQNVYIDKSTSSQLIGQITKDQSFVVVEDQGDWLRIYYPFGNYQSAWVQNNYECFGNSVTVQNPIKSPEFTVTPIPTGDNGYVINLAGVDVKLGPNDGFQTVGTLKYGDHVQVIGEASIPDQYGGWLKIRLDDGTEGWVPKGTIQHVNDPVDIPVVIKPDYYRGHICSGDVVAYSQPGGGSVVATLTEGTNVPIIMQWNNWVQVFIDTSGRTGWINGMSAVCEGYTFPKGDGSGYYNGLYYSRPLTSGYRITQEYSSTHGAVDYGTACGTPVYSTAPGTVYAIVKGFGPGAYDLSYLYKANYVMIAHPNGTYSLYVHLQDVASELKIGMYIPQGYKIGTVGTSGYSTGCHLHFEIRDGQMKIDPESIFNGEVNIDQSITSSVSSILSKNINASDDQILKLIKDYLEQIGQSYLWKWIINLFKHDLNDLDNDSIPDALEKQLMLDFAPVVILEKSDQWKPLNVDLYLKDVTLYYNQPTVGCSDTEFIGRVNTQSNLLDRETQQKEYFSCDKVGRVVNSSTDSELRFYLKIENNDIKNGSSKKSDWRTYSHIYSESKNNLDTIYIQYWFFYPYNDPPDSTSLGIHEGDWEHITIKLSLKDDNYDIDSIKYAAHDDSNIYNKDNLELYQGSKPFVYVGKGTHASFPTYEIGKKATYAKGAYSEKVSKCNLTKTIPYISDINVVPMITKYSCEGPTWETWNNIVNMGEKGNALKDDSGILQEFIYYSGRWGKPNNVAADSIYRAPETPTFKSNWKETW